MRGDQDDILTLILYMVMGFAAAIVLTVISGRSAHL